jgi:hypothetical protein
MNSYQFFGFQFKTVLGVSTADHGSRITDHGLPITRKEGEEEEEEEGVLALALRT